MRRTRVLLPIAIAVSVLVGAAALTVLRSPTPAAEPTPAPTIAPTPVPTPTPLDPITEALFGHDACLLAHRGSRTVAAFRPDASLTPASTQKLLLGAAALDLLGPGHRFTTRTVAGSAPEDGVVGDLWLVGGGDPMLATTERIDFLSSSPRWRELVPTPLSDLADAVVAAGIREVRGGVHGDASRHGPIGYLDAWPSRFIEGNDITPLSALAVDSGWVEWEPPRVPAPDPAIHAAAELTELLRARGVTVAAEPAAAPAPGGAVPVAHVEGAPLVDVLAGILRASHNPGAEMLLRELGTVTTGRPGTTADGARAVADALAAAGVDTRGLALADGSGLSPENRASCRTLVGALRTAFGGVHLPDLLAVAGRSGTLRHRYHDTPLQDAFRAKTGWVRGTVGIAGQLDGPEDLTVALLQNGVPALEDARHVERHVLMELTGDPETP